MLCSCDQGKSLLFFLHPSYTLISSVRVVDGTLGKAGSYGDGLGGWNAAGGLVIFVSGG